jgi:hypothetical protein
MGGSGTAAGNLESQALRLEHCLVVQYFGGCSLLKFENDIRPIGGCLKVDTETPKFGRAFGAMLGNGRTSG